MSLETVIQIVILVGLGAFIPKILSRLKIQVPAVLMPDPVDPAVPSMLPQDQAQPAPAPASRAAKVSPQRPLVACYEWFVSAGAGLIEPTSADLRLAKAIKPHLDTLVTAKPEAPSLSALNTK